MNRGTAFASILVLSAATACRNVPDAEQIAVVDSLITSMEAANLTLNELDLDRYYKATMLLEHDSSRFLQRFDDTLDRSSAMTLAGHYKQLQQAEHMALDHQQVHATIAEATRRLKNLRNDLLASAFDVEDAANAITLERNNAEQLSEMVQQVITNYRTTQNVLANQAVVDSLLSGHGDKLLQP